MAQYLVKEKSFVDGKIVEAGETVDYTPPDGTTVSGNLELIEPKSKGKQKPDSE